MDAYMNLTDEIIRQILLNPDPRLEKARQLVRDVWRRKLYICVVESTPIQGRRLKQVNSDEFLKTIYSTNDDFSNKKNIEFGC